MMSCLESQRCYLRLQGQHQLFLLAFCWEVPKYVAFLARDLAVPLGDDSPGRSPNNSRGIRKTNLKVWPLRTLLFMEGTHTN